MSQAAEATNSRIVAAYRQRTPRSAELAAEAASMFPSGVTHDARYLDPYGVYVERALGPHKWDIDGNRYIDFFGGHGSLILGHCHPKVTEAVAAALSAGTHFGANHPREIAWARAIQRLVPSAERVRFTYSGTEATLMAVRLARAFTGRDVLLRFQGHFHGWNDHMTHGYSDHFDGTPTTGVLEGVAEKAIAIPPRDLDAVAAILASRNDIFGVVLEPTGSMFGQVPLTAEFVRGLRELTATHGVLLIFDEVVTGFRVSRGGAQAAFGIRPDLTTFAKILAGGMPGAAVVGRKEILDLLDFQVTAATGREKVGHPGTYNANPVSAAAGVACLTLLAETDANDVASARAAELRAALNEMLAEEQQPWAVYGFTSGFHLFTNPKRRDGIRPQSFDPYACPPDELKGADKTLVNRMRLALLVNGVDTNSRAGGFTSATHTSTDVADTVAAFRAAIRMLRAEGLHGMTDEELGFLPATELAGMIRSKRISPVELVGAVIRRVERVEPQVNTFVTFAPDQALAAARAAEAAVMQGQSLGPLHGLTATVKDLCWTRDFPTQFGSKIFAGHRTPDDNPTAARLKRAGAVLLGKTTTSEFGWTAVSRSPLTGITHNPWKHGTNAGASSSGAAVGAASGYGALHQGTDGAGSIRLPAHFCGVYGLKPSFGRVPYAPVNPGDYTSHMGPITRTVADSALLLEVMAGPHPLDHTTLEAWPAPYLRRLNEGIAGRRIAFSADLGHARVDPEVAALVRAAAQRFADAAKAHLEAVTPSWGPLGPELGRKFWSAHETRLVPRLVQWEADMDPGLVACIRFGSQISMSDYQALRERKMAYIAAIHTFFEDWDFLITPTASVAAFTAGQLMPDDWPQHAWDWMSWAEFSYPFNMSWNPAATVPCGFTRDGLPVGLQIVGRRFDDLGVLQASAAFEQALPWAHRRPPLA